MKKAILFLVVVLLAQGIYAQSPKKTLKRAEKALGGKKALQQVRSWQKKGKITRKKDGASGEFMAQASSPSFYNGSFDISGFETEVGYNGKSGWIRDSRNGLRTLTGDASFDFQAETNLRNNLWLNRKKIKSKITSGGKSNVNGKVTNVVILTNTRDVSIKLHFDAITNLLLREEIPQGNVVKVFDYSDYRLVNGVQESHTIVSKIGNETFEIKLDEIKHNIPISQASFDFPKNSDEPLPDTKKLLEEIRENANKVDEILENYSYKQLTIKREPTKDGRLVEKSSEKTFLTFYKGYRIERLIEKNGKPLSKNDQAKEDRKAQKQIADIEKRIAERERNKNMGRDTDSSRIGTPGDDGQRITISDALRGSLLVNPRRERFRGRDVIVFDYEPNPAYKAKTRMDKIFALSKGVVWVDSNKKQVVRLEAYLTKSSGNFFGKVKRGASFSLENRLINEEIWLPSVADVDLSVRVLFFSINIDNLIKYDDYKRFTTEVKDAKVNEIEGN